MANYPDETEILVWEKVYGSSDLTAYSRLGIQADFRSWLNPFYDAEGNVQYATKGDYGLKLSVLTDKTLTDEDGNVSQMQYDFYLNCADMNGNPYDF